MMRIQARPHDSFTSVDRIPHPWLPCALHLPRLPTSCSKKS